MADIEYKPVIWVLKAIAIKTEGRKGVEYWHIGYCTVGKGVAFVTKLPLTAFIVGSVDIHKEGENSECGDARWCFNLKCPLNKAEIKKFWKYKIYNKEELKRVHDFLESVVNKLKSIYGEEMFNRNGGYIAFKRGAPLTLYVRKKADGVFYDV